MILWRRTNWNSREAGAEEKRGKGIEKKKERNIAG